MEATKIIAKLRQAIGLSKKYTDEKVAETKEYVDQKFAALPVHEVPVIPVEDIAAQVVAMMPKPKKLKSKKKQIKINTVSPEDVMAMISVSLRDINTEYQKTGDTIIINEAPQRVVEYIREVVTEKGGEVDYKLIFTEVEKQMHRMREYYPVGSANSIRALLDADLTGVPQNARGVYMLGQIGNTPPVTWDYYVTNWSLEPVFNATITEGSVYDYTLDGVTRYRFVPSAYNPTQDAFYETFDGTTLSNLIVTRG